MKLAFTNFVRRVEPGEPRPAGLDEAWEKLRDALVSELRRRSLWNAPPNYLGVYGWTRWSEPEALEELTAECFTAIFLRRLATLKALTGEMANVEGLVFRNIRNFLHDAQKKHNPLGYRVFTVLRAAARRSVEAKALYVLDGDPKIGGTTVLGFAAAGRPREAPGAELAEHVRSWGDDLLPELVTAKPLGLDQVEERMCRHLARLETQGVGAFRFKHLLEPLQDDLRARWNVLGRQVEDEVARADGSGETADVVRLAHPEAGLEERQLFEKLLCCVDTALARREHSDHRTHLETLWAFFKSRAAEALDEGGLTGPPSGRKTAELLGIPRHRLPGLSKTLREEVEKCRRALRRPVRQDGGQLATEAREPAIR